MIISLIIHDVGQTPMIKIVLIVGTMVHFYLLRVMHTKSINVYNISNI